MIAVIGANCDIIRAIVFRDIIDMVKERINITAAPIKRGMRTDTNIATAFYNRFYGFVAFRPVMATQFSGY